MADIQALRQMAIDAELMTPAGVLHSRLLKFARAVEADSRARCLYVLNGLDIQANGRHNYYLFAAEAILEDAKERSND